MIYSLRSTGILFSKLLFFWLLAFCLERLIAVFYFIEKIPANRFIEYLEIFFNSLRLDLSMAAYLVVIPLVVVVLFQYFNKQSWASLFFKIYQPILIVLFLLISFVNLNLYREWGTKLNYKAIVTFIDYPYEVTISGVTWALLLPFILYFFLGILLFRINKVIYVKSNFTPIQGNLFFRTVISVLLLGVNFLFIRGGWQLSPINVSMSQYSSIPVYNHLATNTMWQLMQNTLFELMPIKSRYVYFSEKEMEKLLEDKNSKDSTIHILKPTVQSPNVVFILLESFTADVIKSMGGEPGIAPNIENIIKEGVLFKNIYSTGERTDKGIIAILSSFPAQPTRSIIRENHKQIHLTSIAQEFKKRNYHTSFYYGGESEFFGLKSYLLSHAYDVVVDKNSFLKKDFNSKWGAHDGVLFDKHLEDLKTQKTPFFTNLLTLSNHEPFEFPIPAKYKGNQLADLFRNTAYYTDYTLGKYIEKAKKQPWYSNTLFVIVADHGHRLPLEKYEIWDARRHRIPLILFGDVIKDELKGTTNEIYGSQVDISQTIFNQLDMKVTPNIWSHDLLRSNPNNGFAFFDWDNGFGLVAKNYTLSYNEDAKKIIQFKAVDSSIKVQDKLNFAKAYMQKVFGEYMKY